MSWFKNYELYTCNFFVLILIKLMMWYIINQNKSRDDYNEENDC